MYVILFLEVVGDVKVYRIIEKSLTTLLLLLFVILLTLSFSFNMENIHAKGITTVPMSIKERRYLISKKEARAYKVIINNKKIVKSTKSKKIVALKSGSTNVTFKNKRNNKKIVYKVIVKDNSNINISLGKGKNYKGHTYTITSNYKKGLVYKSTNNKIIKISSNRARMNKKGSAYILAYKGNKLVAYLNVKVYAKNDVRFKEDSPVVIALNSSKKLHVINEKKKNIKFYSNSKKIARVDKKGKVKAIRPGKALITLKTKKGKTDSILVIVKNDKGFVTNSLLKRHHADKYKNVMIVAHPDDETLWGGANLYNDSYFVVCLTNGATKKRARDYKKILNFTNSDGLILEYPDAQGGIRDDWTYQKKGISNDVHTILNYKNWKKIVTYNPEGVTGHIHHKMTYKHVRDEAVRTNQLNKVYYFERFFKKGHIPSYAHRISNRDLEIKKQEVNLYQSVIKDIYKYWYYMLPYEYFIKDSNWYLRYPVKSKEVEKNDLSLKTSSINVLSDNNKNVKFLDNSISISLYEGEILKLDSIPLDLNAKIDTRGLDNGYNEVPLGVNYKYLLGTETKVKVYIEEK